MNSKCQNPNPKFGIWALAFLWHLGFDIWISAYCVLPILSMDNTYLGNGPVPIPKDPDSNSREYNRRKYLLVIISLLMGLGYLLAMTLYLSVPLREWATSMSVGAR